MRRNRAWIAIVCGCSLFLSGCMAHRPPVMSISAEPSSGYSPLVVQFEAVGIDSESSSFAYDWDFGDGTVATGSILEHEFTGKGAIPVRLVATDAKGRQTVIERDITLLNRIPHAQFFYDPNPAPTHHPVRFDASASYDPDGEILSYRWDFGDGSTAEGATVTHAFEMPHVAYRVVLTVTDDSGDENSMYRDLELIGCDH